MYSMSRYSTIFEISWQKFFYIQPEENIPDTDMYFLLWPNSKAGESYFNECVAGMLAWVQMLPPPAPLPVYLLCSHHLLLALAAVAVSRDI